MRNYILLILLAIGLSTSLSAQVGIKGGLNLANVNIEALGEDLDTDSKVAFHLGVFYEADISGNLFIRPELLYSGKGYNLDVDFFGLGSVESTLSINYIELPIYLGYRIDLGSTNLVVNAGPYLAYALGGTVETDGEEEDLNFGSDESDDLKAFDIGLSIGAGLEFTENIGVFVSFDPGIADLETTDSDDSSAKNSNLKFSVHYKL